MPDHVLDRDGPPVALLHWPRQERERRRLAGRGRPRVLLISDYLVPPGLLDDRELWLLDTADPPEILAAIQRLCERAPANQSSPTLDDDGLLRFGGRWVAVPDRQLPVVELLVRNVGRIVRTDAVRVVYQRAGGSTQAASVRALIYRIGQRLAHLGLELHVIRQRGIMLAVPAGSTVGDPG